MTPKNPAKAFRSSMALLCVALCLTSCAFTSCSPAVQQDVRVTEEEYVVNTAIDLSSKLGKPVYLSSLVAEYGSASAAFAALISYGKVVVDFYADWCGPCRALGKALEKLAQERSDVLFVKVDVDEYSDIAGRYGVRSIPTIILFKNGSQVHKATGFNGEAALKATINANL
jgi:thioredoxin 1